MNKFKGQIEYAPIPLRIKDAREYCRFSMVELADKIDKTRQANLFHYFLVRNRLSLAQQQ